MPETLLSPSNLLLYGRLVEDIQIVHKDTDAQKRKDEEEIHRPFVAPRTGVNQLLEDQLSDPAAQFARIYAFSYEGHYYDLAKPALFLVHGDGQPAERVADVDPRAPRGLEGADRTGVAATDLSWSDDMRVWSYDKGDFSIRLDIETGPLDQILLDMELEADQMRSYLSGANVRSRGANVRMQGANVRMQGANVRGRGSSD